MIENNPGEPDDSGRPQADAQNADSPNGGASSPATTGVSDTAAQDTAGQDTAGQEIGTPGSGLIGDPEKPKPGQLTLTPARRGKPPTHWVDLDPDARVAAVKDLGLPAFRAKQIGVQYFDRQVRDVQAMTDLPASARDSIAKALFPSLLNPVSTIEADGGDTIKTLWKLVDGARVESVLMRYPGRATLCVSSQAGCGMNCPFCATGQAGLTRNMSAAEIVDQVVAATNELRSRLSGDDAAQARVNNVVFMGMGEPLANFNAVATAVRRMTDEPPHGLGMSARNITVSTVGLVPAMNKLADLGIPVTLALSLHAPDDELRDELVPINTRWNVKETLDTARDYFDRTGRRVSIEYALIRDMNDHQWRAKKLAGELNRRGRGWVHVNPIPLNPTPGSIWTASDRRVQNTFVETLRDAGIPTTVRDTRGQDIDGACGQLAAAHVENDSSAGETPKETTS